MSDKKRPVEVIDEAYTVLIIIIEIEITSRPAMIDVQPFTPSPLQECPPMLSRRLGAFNSLFFIDLITNLDEFVDFPD